MQISEMCLVRKITTNNKGEQKMKIKLTNSFHNKETFVITKDDQLSKEQVKRAKKKLCPYKDCHCSNELGAQNSGFTAIIWQDGSATIKKDEVEK